MTVNRGWLKRQVEKGAVTMVGSYHYDDMMGEEKSTTERPVAIRPESWSDRKEGVCYLFASDFKTKSGCAYRGANGTITLIVHSNCSYDLRIAEI